MRGAKSKGKGASHAILPFFAFVVRPGHKKGVTDALLVADGFEREDTTAWTCTVQ